MARYVLLIIALFGGIYGTSSESSIRRTPYAPLRDLRNRPAGFDSRRFPTTSCWQPEKFHVCLHGFKSSIDYEVDHNDGNCNDAIIVSVTPCRHGVRRRVNRWLDWRSYVCELEAQRMEALRHGRGFICLRIAH